MTTVTVKNTTKSDLGLSEQYVVPAMGAIEVPVKAMEGFSENPVIQAWVEDGWLADGSDKGEKKTKKRTGLEAQAEKLEVEFTDDTSDDDLIAAIKAKKDAAK